MNRQDEGLKSLGHKTDYRTDYAPDVLETFDNKHPDNDYWVRFNAPSLRLCAPLRDNPTLPKSEYPICPIKKWWRARA